MVNVFVLKAFMKIQSIRITVTNVIHPVRPVLNKATIVYRVIPVNSDIKLKIVVLVFRDILMILIIFVIYVVNIVKFVIKVQIIVLNVLKT